MRGRGGRRGVSVSRYQGVTYHNMTERRCSASHWNQTTRSYLAILAVLQWLLVQRRFNYKLACFVFSSLSGHAPPYVADDIHLVSERPGRRLYALPPTDRVPFHAHTTLSATGASLSLGHVFGTVFRPTCTTRTLHTTVSGVNSKRFCFNVASGAQ